jgi:predicted phosphoadenosine phosphosulfate sulfurtransferase
MGRAKLGVNVVRAALDRLEAVYAAGHRVVVTVSGGKDSVVCLELAIMAARKYGRLPVDVCTQDEEINFPGTYESLERMAQRKEVRMRWFCMQQPMLNVFNREQPYWWCHDPQLPPEKWVRRPPSYAEFVEEKTLENIVQPAFFPVEHVAKPGDSWDPEDKRQRLVTVVGLRVQESVKRLLGLFSAGGAISKANQMGAHLLRPIYDWTEGDVWKFIRDTKADYNSAYNVLYRMGCKKNLRIGPPTMTLAGINQLQIASRAWPAWFEKFCERVPGTRTAAMFGKRAVTPRRRVGESWQQCFERECLGPETPGWIAERALIVMQKALAQHAKHATSPFPEHQPCNNCGYLCSWKHITNAMWNGDPYSFKTLAILPLIEPDHFRPGAGKWNFGRGAKQ